MKSSGNKKKKFKITKNDALMIWYLCQNQIDKIENEIAGGYYFREESKHNVWEHAKHCTCIAIKMSEYFLGGGNYSYIYHRLFTIGRKLNSKEKPRLSSDDTSVGFLFHGINIKNLKAFENKIFNKSKTNKRVKELKKQRNKISNEYFKKLKNIDNKIDEIRFGKNG